MTKTHQTTPAFDRVAGSPLVLTSAEYAAALGLDAFGGFGCYNDAAARKRSRRGKLRKNAGAQFCCGTEASGGLNRADDRTVEH